MRRGIRYSTPRAKGCVMKSRLHTYSLLLLCWTLLVVHAAIGKKTPPASPLDLNTATATQLAQVPGIGASSARAIVRFRQKSGPFERVEDLLAIRGISERKLEQIRPYVTVSRVPRKPSSSRGSAIFSA